MINFNIKSCLVLAPHTDDGEFGCGATIARLVKEKVEIHYIAFSICEDSVPKAFPKDILLKEVAAATSALGILKANVEAHKFKVRYFSEVRQDILQHLYDFNTKNAPDLVICPSSDDIHQDHHVVYQEAVRAFKNSTILGYELPWNHLHFKHDVFIQVSQANIDKKIEAVQCYSSQKGRSYLDESFINGMAKMRGVQSNLGLAESFELIRMRVKL